MPFGVLINPRLWPAIGLADVGADRECLQIVDCRAAVIALVCDDFLDHCHRIIGDRGHRVELLGGLGQRLLDRGRVAFVGCLHRDPDDRARLEIDRVLRFVRQMRPTVLQLGDLRVKGWLTAGGRSVTATHI